MACAAANGWWKTTPLSNATTVDRIGVVEHTNLRNSDREAAREALFDLFGRALVARAPFAPLAAIDGFVAARRGGIFLKHDVHDLDLDRLVVFAEREARLGIHGTYFFMTPNHPRTAKSYDFTSQARAMLAIQQLGHELGLHLDPYYQIHKLGAPLAEIVRKLCATFAAHGITILIGNMHGNSAHKRPDFDGYGTSFDLFDEIARQPDYPVLARLPVETADLVRANRTRLAEYGFMHWGDMPIWSAALGFVVTNFLTDNRFGKHGTYELLVQAQTLNAYQVTQRQPPGSRNRRQGKTIALREVNPKAFPSHKELAPGDPELRALFATPSRMVPLQILLHPEFYC